MKKPAKAPGKPKPGPLTLAVSEAYLKHLRRLGRTLAAEGVAIDPDSPIAVIDALVVRSAESLDITPVRRATPPGKRPGAGRKPKPQP